MHENLCRIATEHAVPVKRIDVPWLIETAQALEEAGISIEQSLVLGTFMAGSALAAIREQAAQQ
jgi:hypothetical protein